MEGQQLYGSPIDWKNIGLAKTLFCLRQDLDIYLLLNVNAAAIKNLDAGKDFWGHLQGPVIKSSIVLNICKVYELEKNYPLDSIPGILKYLFEQKLSSQNEPMVNEFCQKYEGPSGCQPIDALQKTFEGFKEKNSSHLKSFKNCRDKIVAHRESEVGSFLIPAPAIMENLFDFGADFYHLISHSFIGNVGAELKENRPVKWSLINIFKELGLHSIKTDYDDE